MSSGRTLVISLGHRLRGDDGLGPYILDRLLENCADKAEFKEYGGDGAGLLDLMEAYYEVIIVDALNSAADEDGSIYEIDGLRESLPLQESLSSSHVLGLTEALALGRVLGRLPKCLTIYGVVGSRFNLGEGLSEPVSEAAEQVVTTIANKLNERQVHA